MRFSWKASRSRNRRRCREISLKEEKNTRGRINKLRIVSSETVNRHSRETVPKENGSKGIETCWTREDGSTPLVKRDGSRETKRLEASEAVLEKRRLAKSFAPSKEKSFGEV